MKDSEAKQGVNVTCDDVVGLWQVFCKSERYGVVWLIGRDDVSHFICNLMPYGMIMVHVERIHPVPPPQEGVLF